jgi:hypothetical protein
MARAAGRANIGVDQAIGGDIRLSGWLRLAVKPDCYHGVTPPRATLRLFGLFAIFADKLLSADGPHELVFLGIGDGSGWWLAFARIQLERRRKSKETEFCHTGNVVSHDAMAK